MEAIYAIEEGWIMFKFIGNFLYNLDRMVASLFGAPPQETLSSYFFGRRKIPGHLDDIGAKILDKIDPNHIKDAVTHADKLNSVDDGKEK